MSLYHNHTFLRFVRCSRFCISISGDVAVLQLLAHYSLCNGSLHCCHALADEDPTHAECVQRAADAVTLAKRTAKLNSTIVTTGNISGTANGTAAGPSSPSSLLSYPKCEYTRAQLNRLVDIMTPWLQFMNYSVPLRCAAVLAGDEPGGSDAHTGRAQALPSRKPASGPVTGACVCLAGDAGKIVRGSHCYIKC